MIFTRHGIDIKKYPTIENYLLPFKERLMPKPNNYKGKEWKGRKPGAYQWYEIQDTIDYFEEFEKPKMLFPDISMRGNFVFDQNGNYCVNTAYIIPVNDLYLLGILNSRLVTFFYKNLSNIFRGGYLRFIYQYLVQIPIKVIDSENNKEKPMRANMIEIVETMLELQKKYHDSRLESEKNMFKKQSDILDQKIDRLVYELYGLTEAEIKIVEQKDA